MSSDRNPASDGREIDRTFRRMLLALTALLVAHFSLFGAVYTILENPLGSWGATFIALAVYWVTRNVVVYNFGNRIRAVFRAKGERDRARKRTLPRWARVVIWAAFGTYAFPLDAYDGDTYMDFAYK